MSDLIAQRHTHRSPLARARREGVIGYRAGLGRAEYREQLCTERPFNSIDLVRLEATRTNPHEAKLVSSDGFVKVGRASKDRAEVRETGRQRGDLILLDRGEEPVDVGFRQAKNGCAAQKRVYERGI